MNTRNILDIYTRATSNLINALDMLNHVGQEQFEEITGQDDFMHVSGPSNVVRDIMECLPESLQHEDHHDLIMSLYPHKCKENMVSMIPAARKAFDHAHALSKEWYEVKEKFGFDS